MQNKDTVLNLFFEHSNKELSLDLKALEEGITEFLEYYATPALVGQDFCTAIGEGDGRTKFAKLLEVSGYQNDSQGFFQKLLPQLAQSNRQEKRVNTIVIPHLLLVSLLEKILPGNGYISIKDVAQLVQVTNLAIPDEHRAELQQVIDTYPVRLSSHTIRQMMVSKDVAYQYMPFVEELDSVGHTNTWIGQFHQGLLEQMYQNRVIFLLNMSCPVYCRFCFRKHKESRNEANPTVEDVKAAVEHVRNSPSIKEIVITGGDPFMNRANMDAAIDGLMQIEHVQTLRLATRCIAYYPDLFLKNESAYLNYLKQKNFELQQRSKRMEVATHFIHPDEISPESLDIISDLVMTGIPVYVQTPFLKDCNDKGPELVKLFSLLHGAGAELHYIYIPCSPIHGNSIYWSTLSEGIGIGAYLRAHLSDRVIPRICTATPIGKLDWHTSGWAVEQVEGQENFVWLRSPYTPQYFKSFAPLASELNNIRVNAEGTIDIQYMAKIGDESLLLGSRPPRKGQRPVLDESVEQPKIEQISDLLTGSSIVNTESDTLSRLHETRVAIQANADEADLDYIRSDTRITDVVIASETDTVDSVHAISKLIKKLYDIPHVNAVRLRSLKFNDAPQTYTPTLINRLGELNRLTIANPLRLEIETWFLSAEEIQPEHAILTRRLTNKGITVYSNTPLLGGINDSPEAIHKLAYACRQAGIEFHHLYVAGLPIQQQWNSKHPVDMYDVIDIATMVRREGSGREIPRYIVQTPFGEVDYGLTSSFIHENGKIFIKPECYTLSYFKTLDPNYSLPETARLDQDGKLLTQISGLTGSSDFPI